MDYAALETPSHCIVDFSVVPVRPLRFLFHALHPSNTNLAWQIGTPSPTFSHEIAAILRLLKCSGLVFETHPSGTTIGKNLMGQSLFPHRSH